MACSLGMAGEIEERLLSNRFLCDCGSHEFVIPPGVELLLGVELLTIGPRDQFCRSYANQGELVMIPSPCMPNLGHDLHVSNHNRYQVLGDLGNSLDSVLSHGGVSFVSLPMNQYNHGILILQMQCRDCLWELRTLIRENAEPLLIWWKINRLSTQNYVSFKKDQIENSLENVSELL